MVAHREDTLIEDLDVFDSFLALSVRSGGLAKIAIQPWDAKLQQPTDTEFFIDSDEPSYTASLSVNPQSDTEVLRYAYSSLSTPTSIYDYNVRTREQVLVQARVRVNPPRLLHPIPGSSNW